MDEGKSIRRVEITVNRRVRSIRMSGSSGLTPGEPCPVCGRVVEATLEAPKLEIGTVPKLKKPELPK